LHKKWILLDELVRILQNPFQKLMQTQKKFKNPFRIHSFEVPD